MGESTKIKLEKIGEFGLIYELTKDIKIKNKETIVGVGDDAAVLEYPNEQIVVTTDLLIEGIHFDLAYTALKYLGYKAAIVNISDVLAMNAFPKQLLVSIGVSNRFSLKDIQELYSGVKLACGIYKLDLVGGDTSSSVQGLFISITAIGANKKELLTYRNGAKKGDYICVSGNLGAAYMGLHLLKRENAVFQSDPSLEPELSGKKYILERQLKPEARMDIVRLFAAKQIKPTSMIDVSDGLSSELMHLTEASKVSCEIFEEQIPIHAETREMANEFNFDESMPALNGGEDYELLFSLSPEDYKKIKDYSAISLIGKMRNKEQGNVLTTSDGNRIPLSARGWNAFGKNNKSDNDSSK